ncbi:MAG: hypothetical protein ABEI06_09460 [Halobacteriaceae archaeon]
MENTIDDGKRIAELLSSEVTGHETELLDEMTIVNVNEDVSPSVEGDRAYDINYRSSQMASIFIHEDRAHIELREGLESAKEAAHNQDLRIRPVGTSPPHLTIFLENGADVKQVIPILKAAANSINSA